MSVLLGSHAELANGTFGLSIYVLVLLLQLVAISKGVNSSAMKPFWQTPNPLQVLFLPPFFCLAAKTLNGSLNV